MSSAIWFLPVLSAILGILALPPFGYYLLGFIFLAPLFIFFLEEKSLSRLIIGTLLFRLIFLTFTVNFAFDPLLVLTSAIIFIGLPISFFAARIYLKEKIAFAGLPILWAIWDYLEAQYSFLPYFSVMAGSTLGSSPFLGLAGSGGIITLTLFIAAINALISCLIFKLINRDFKKSALTGTALIGIIIGGIIFSRYQLNQNRFFFSAEKSNLTVALLSNNEKFDEEFLQFKTDIFSEKEKEIAAYLTQNLLSRIELDLIGPKIDLLVLPEDMIDIETWNDADEEAKIKFGISNAGILIKSYRQLAKNLNTNIIAALTTFQNGKRYNSAVLFNRRGELVDVYNKSHLTIASEYWPFGDWQPFYYQYLAKITPDLGSDNAMFNPDYRYSKGSAKLLTSEEFKAGLAICIEIHYPSHLKNLKKLGAQFILNAGSNRWTTLGLKNLIELTLNFRKIEAVWLKTPIIFNGRKDYAGIIMPDGKTYLTNFESQDKNYGILVAELGDL
mgnify:FL=1